VILFKGGYVLSSFWESRVILWIEDYSVTLGLSRYWSLGRNEGNQATSDNSQQNNLRSCMWVLWVVVFGFSLSIGVRNLFLLSARTACEK